MTLSSVFDLAEEAWNFITLTTTDMLVVRNSRVFSSDAEESATSDNDFEDDSFKAYAEEDLMDVDERCEELLREVGIEDEYELIHVDDDCPVYECITGTDIVKNPLNTLLMSLAENDDNDHDKNNDPTHTTTTTTTKNK